MAVVVFESEEKIGSKTAKQNKWQQCKDWKKMETERANCLGPNEKLYHLGRGRTEKVTNSKFAWNKKKSFQNYILKLGQGHGTKMAENKQANKDIRIKLEI